MTTSNPKGPTAVVKWMAVLLLLVTAALVVSLWRGRQSKSVADPVVMPRAVTARGDLAADEQATIELFDRVRASVVHVTSVDYRENALSLDMATMSRYTGSGFVWDDKGHIVTNFHVIQAGRVTEVALADNSVWPAQTVGSTPEQDLAVVKISAPADALRPIALGTSDDLRVGQKVFAIGNPFGLDQTLTVGVISGVDREIQALNDRPIKGVVQTDAAINPGNSGGPLLDSAGRVIGVNTATKTASAGSGIGFAVPVSTVNEIVPQLIAHGRVVRPGLGITPLSDALGRRFRIQGVAIRQVSEGGGAHRAGLRGLSRDRAGGWRLGDVIVAIDDKPVERLTDLYRGLDDKKVGDTVVLHLVRGGHSGKRHQAAVVLQDLAK